MDSTQLERGTLESKDRDELTTIATALGGKPGSRARKAEIVDLILDLSGGGNGAPSNGGWARTTASTAAPAEESAEEPPAEWEVATAAEETAGADGDQPANSDTSAEAGEEASTATGAEADADRAGDQKSGRDGGRGQGGQNRDRQGDRQGGRQGGQQGGQNRDRQGGQNRDGQGDNADPGNRRRRRRGRERDQPSGPEEVWDGEPVEIEGHLDLRDEGYGFLRTGGYKPSKNDAYISVKQVRQFSLRRGDHLVGASRPANRSEKNPALLRIDKVNGRDPELAKSRPKFEDLTPLFPDEKLRMEIDGDPTNMTARIIDLLSPIGKGQRGMIVSPPKAGKTTIVKSIVRSIETNHPEVKLIVLLVDERPEEVTDMKRWLQRGEVVGSTFDRPSDEHTQLAEVTIERAKRMVEYGEDVVIVLDGITRLSRAYNLAVGPGTGRIMSGGLDTGALYPPKRFFGAARNVEEGGSLTILATALVDTGSKMDEVIFEEFKGTGNMELRLDRRIAERRVYPAIDVDASSTRHEELLFERKQLNQVWKLRRVLNGLANDGSGAAAGLELLIDRLKTFNNNEEFLVEIAKGPSMGD
jgi:transcription termination factor Rho